MEDKLLGTLLCLDKAVIVGHVGSSFDAGRECRAHKKKKKNVQRHIILNNIYFNSYLSSIFYLLMRK